MTQFKTILMTAALLAAPSVAFAQISTGAVTDQLKKKAVEGVMDNMTGDDALTAGKTMLKGGSKEDAAVAIVKGRAEGKVDSMTGGNVDLDDLSKDGVMDAGKDAAMDKAKGSATKYTNGVPSVDGLSTGSVMGAGKEMAMEKAQGSASKYTNGTAVIPKSGVGSATTSSAPVGSGTTYSAPASTGSSTTYSAPATTTVNCPAGTKAAGDGTCMITGNWKY